MLSEILNVRNMVGMAVRPDLSLILALADAHICSRVFSSEIQESGEEIIEVR
jgi:hypothetical protein